MASLFPRRFGVPNLTEVKAAYVNDPYQAHQNQISRSLADMGNFSRSIGFIRDHAQTTLLKIGGTRPDSPGFAIMQDTLSALDSTYDVENEVFLSLWEQHEAMHRWTLPGPVFDAHFHIERMHETRAATVKLYNKMQQLSEDLDDAREIFGEGKEDKTFIESQIDHLQAYTLDLKIALTTGRVRVIEKGLRAWVRDEKTRWEDEMILTRLVPVS